jgi:hypothetical protein
MTTLELSKSKNFHLGTILIHHSTTIEVLSCLWEFAAGDKNQALVLFSEAMQALGYPVASEPVF